MRLRSAAVMALVILVIASYWPVLNNGFVYLDDQAYVFENATVSQGLTMHGLAWAFTSLGYQSNWHPLTWLSHMADVSLFGLSPRGHHLTSLLLHLVTAVMLFLFFYKATGWLWRSFLVATFFAVHPLHVESVAWVAERKDVLSAFLGIATLLLYRRYLVRRRPTDYLMALLVYAAALLSKPMVVTLPLIMLLLDYWPFGRLRAARVPFGPAPARLVLEKAPFLLLAAASSLVTYIAQLAGGAVNTLAALPLGPRAVHALSSYWTYLGKTFWPARLSVFYVMSQDALTAARGVTAGAGLALVTFVLARLSGRRPCLVSGWTWYLVTLIPVIGLVKVGEQDVADRYTYLPLIGIFVLVVWALADIRAFSRIPKAVLAAGTACLLALLAVLTWRQAALWHDSYTLFDHALEVHGDNWKVHGMKGGALAHDGRYREADAEFGEAIRLRPEHPEMHFSYGWVLAGQRRWDEAADQFAAAVRLEPRMAKAYNCLGNVLAEKGMGAEAERNYHQALQLKPGYPEASYNLAIFLDRQGRRMEARHVLNEALERNPRFEQGRRLLRSLGGPPA